MLTNDKHPVAWALLLWQLSDAVDHLNALIEQMARTGSIDEIDYAIQLGHIYAHLNRAWHGRAEENLAELSDEEREKHTAFPTDLSPVG